MAIGVKPPNAGKGRPKGVPNKTTAAIKDMVLQALDKAGGVDYLVQQSEENPTAFMTLVGKVLPLQITGDGGGPVETRNETKLKVEGLSNEQLRALASIPVPTG